LPWAVSDLVSNDSFFSISRAVFFQPELIICRKQFQPRLLADAPNMHIISYQYDSQGVILIFGASHQDLILGKAKYRVDCCLHNSRSVQNSWNISLFTVSTHKSKQNSYIQNRFSTTNFRILNSKIYRATNEGDFARRNREEIDVA